MSPRMRPGARKVLRLCLFTVHGASHLVPSSNRDDWRGTWEAELWHRVLTLDRQGRLSLRAGAALFHRCLGAYWHAAWVLGRSLAPRALLAEGLLAARELAAAPAATAVAVLSLGLTLGLGGMVLGVTQAARARVAAAGQERVVRLWNRAPAAQIGRTGLSSLELRTFRAESRSIEALAGVRAAVVTLGTGVEATTVDAGMVSPEFFETLGVTPELGRTFGASEDASDRAGASPPVVLDATLWRERFGGDPATVGRSVAINGAPHRVVGVVPADLRIPRGARLWLPLGALPESPGSHAVGAVGRLRADVTPASAERELNRLSRRLQTQFPGGYLGQLGVAWSVVAEPVGGRGVRVFRLLTLLAAGAALTVFAGIGAAASVSARRLHARPSGARGMQALVTVVTATAIGALLALGTLRVLGPWLDGWLPGARTAGANGEALELIGVGAVVALVAHLVGIRPRRSSAGTTARPGVPVAMLACAATLVLGAGICAWGYHGVQGSGTGFRASGLLAVTLGPDGRARADWPRLVAGLPRVETVSRSFAAPLVQSLPGVTFVTDGSSTGATAAPMTADLQLAEPAYFGIVGLPLVAGRTFRSPPSPDSTGRPLNEVVVDASLAARFWPGGSPLGHRVRVVLDAGRVTDWLTVVGVAADLYGRAPGELQAPLLYLPVGLDSTSAATTLLVRTSLTPAELAMALRQAGAGHVQPVDVAAVVAARAAPYLAASMILLALAGVVILLAGAPRALRAVAGR